MTQSRLHAAQNALAKLPDLRGNPSYPLFLLPPPPGGCTDPKPYSVFSWFSPVFSNTPRGGEGGLGGERPNFLNWHMTQPDESILVSDGKTLWFYNPFVEQATATWLKDATGNTPFMLIARNQSSDWQQYNIKQNGDDFVLTPKASNGNLKQFTINVGRDGTIHQFSAVEQDDQRSSYQLKSQQNGAVDAAKFTFTPPQGVTVDDQRK
ncbi:outer membrane lipoprotein chaperone LolA [Escherichia coli]